MNEGEMPVPDPGGTRWLSAEELQDWLAINAMLLVVPARLDAELRQNDELSLYSYLLMARLSEAADRTLGLSDLAQITHGSLSKLSHALTVLERRGWVVRQPSPLGGRSMDAVLTDEGYVKVVKTAPSHVETVRRLVLDAISPAQRRLMAEAAAAVLQANGTQVPTSPPAPDPTPP